MVTRGPSALDTFVQQTRRLYTIPAVAVEVLSLAEAPDVDVARVRQCVERDPALAVKLLRIVNGSMYGVGRKITQLNEAIALLGANTIKLLALGFSLPERLFLTARSDVLQRYWRRTLTRAVAAREFARLGGTVDADECFITALLADLGILVLVQEAGEKYLPLYRAAGDDRARLITAEREAFDFDHVTLTARLLNDWRLPNRFVESILAAHQADAATSVARPTTLPAVVRTADLLAALLTEERADLWPSLRDAAQRGFGLGVEELERLSDGVERMVANLADDLHLTLPTGDAYREVVERAHRLMASASERAVTDWLTQGTGRPLNPSAPSPAVPERDASERSEAAAGTDPAPADLTTHLRALATACRDARRSFGFCLIAVDRTPEPSVVGRGNRPAAATATLALLCRKIFGPDVDFVPLDGGRAALLLPGYDRRATLEPVTELRRRFPPASLLTIGRTTLSIGVVVVGVPPRDPPVAEMIAAAERCLYAAQAGLGDAVKTIELY
jgi:HD-like signal output (HDOD) protein